MTAIAENVASIRKQIQRLEDKYARPRGAVTLLAVSKRHGIAEIREAYAAGIRDFGENYLQEALEKMDKLEDIECNWHFIGPLQSNKTRAVAERFDWVHSVDRDKIARRLSQQRPASAQPLNVCIQVNLSAEASKSGVSVEDCGALCDLIATLENLSLRGLMAIPAVSGDMAEQRGVFARLTALFREQQARHPDLDTLSMGMSGDYEAAIAEGATIIRLGTALFGPRD